MTITHSNFKMQDFFYNLHLVEGLFLKCQHLCLYVHTFLICKYMCVCVYVYTCVCTHIYVYIHTHTLTYICRHNATYYPLFCLSHLWKNKTLFVLDIDSLLLGIIWFLIYSYKGKLLSHFVILSLLHFQVSLRR